VKAGRIIAPFLKLQGESKKNKNIHRTSIFIGEISLTSVEGEEFWVGEQLNNLE
jgi:hypothetical protein